MALLNIYFLFVLFIIGGLVGWVIDFVYRRTTDRNVSYVGYLSYLTKVSVPFLPIYGFGLIIVYLLHGVLGQTSFLIRLLVYLVALTLLELFGGLFARYVLKKDLWDYSKNRFNLLGIIDLKHSIFWMILGTLVSYIISLL